MPVLAPVEAFGAKRFEGAVEADDLGFGEFGDVLHGHQRDPLLGFAFGGFVAPVPGFGVGIVGFSPHSLFEVFRGVEPGLAVIELGFHVVDQADCRVLAIGGLELIVVLNHDRKRDAAAGDGRGVARQAGDRCGAGLVEKGEDRMAANAAAAVEEADQLVE